MSKFFIDRPIFAWVLAIIVMMLGAMAVRSLPIAQYPSIAPPSVAITVNYPGAWLTQYRTRSCRSSSNSRIGAPSRAAAMRNRHAAA